MIRSDLLLGILGHGVTAAVAIAASLMLTNASNRTPEPPRIVTFDPDRSVIAFVASIPEDATDADLKSRIAGFHDRVLAETTALAARERVVVVDAASVLTGATDVTDLILERVLQ